MTFPGTAAGIAWTMIWSLVIVYREGKEPATPEVP